MSIIGETVLSVSIEMLFKKLASKGLQLFAQREQIRADIKKWERILSKIYAVLDDVEERQTMEPSVKLWRGELQNLTYDVEDILDEFATDALRKKLLHEPQPSSSKLRKFIPACCTIFNPQTIKFDFMMRHKIDEITTRLQTIEREKNQLDLKEKSGRRSKKFGQRLPTTSLVNEAKVYGREKDKEAIVELLLRDDLSTDDGFSVIPIIGMGGVGKTTLAQLVYNDDRMRAHFDLKAWICVSEDFDVIRVTKTILKSIANGFEDNDLNLVQEKLKKELLGKKFLFVLDDIWNENYNDWTVLTSPFEFGAPGSKIIVTTRNHGVVSMMGNVQAFELKKLSNNECLSVFTQHSLGTRDFNRHQSLKEIGDKIVTKCDGLPLAAKALGGLLRGKDDPIYWEEVLNSKIWNLSEEKCDVIPALKVSYHYLSPHLKQCFAYCSLFPKDYEFQKDEIILLWMAEGFVQLENNETHVEDSGHKSFNELYSRSFFQQSSSDTSKFVMHDLINDLAQWAAGDTYFRMEGKLEGNKQADFFKNLRHLSYNAGDSDGIRRFEAFYDSKSLRTFLPVSSRGGNYFLTRKVVIDMLPKLPCLRVLSLRRYSMSELPNDIGNLIHLRYLNLSKTSIKSLPESVSTLYNLETLLLENCFLLRKLCADVGNLINLRLLNISGASSVEAMPLRIGELTSLRTLSNFVVNKDIGSRLGVLKSLMHLQQSLCISKLENLNDANDAREADLTGKRNLEVLQLEWSRTYGDSPRNAGIEMQVLDMLQPHQKLKELTIRGYSGTKFPIWLGDSSFSSLVILKLRDCDKCTSLPTVGQLSVLKKLVIEEMPRVKNVGPEFYGNGCSEPFPSLETLHFKYMQGWKDWIPYESGQEVEGFSHLRELLIVDCPNLLGRLPERLPSLERLIIRQCQQMLVSVPSLPKLYRLEVDECKEMMQRSIVEFSSLNSVIISNIYSQLSFERFMQGLSNSKVEELKIGNCKSGLTSLWQNGIKLLQGTSTLRRLEIEQCSQLLSLVAEEEKEQLQGLPCRLQYLSLRSCDSLLKLPQALHSFSSLGEISVANCGELVSFPEVDPPPQLRYIGIFNCKALKSLSEAWMSSRSKSLERLSINECYSLTHIARIQLPPNLKRLEIKSCYNLQALVDEEGISITPDQENIKSGSNMNTSLLEYLSILYCPSLKSLWSKSELPATLQHIDLEKCETLPCLSSRGNLPKALKYLSLGWFPRLESIADICHSSNSLEVIDLSSCENLKCLPNDLHKLSRLQKINIWFCPSLVSFPEEGLPCAKLTELQIVDCNELEALPKQMYNLTSLQELTIKGCPSIVSLPEGGFPTNLTSMNVDPEICNLLFNWGFHRLNSLKNLCISGECSNFVSFPQEKVRTALANSLTSLKISYFPNLEFLSSVLLQPTSLETLEIHDCPKLKYFPEEGFPPSLLNLIIWNCPLLEEKCKLRRGQYWLMIADIPCVIISFIPFCSLSEEEMSNSD